MSKDVVQDIFIEKNKLNDIYPRSPGVTLFDLERKHFFYGRIDKEGDVVIMDTQFLVGVESAANSINLLMDFVADAFFSLKVNYRKAIQAAIGKDSIYYRDLKVYKSWSLGSLDTSYLQYVKTLYRNFVDTYLALNRRGEKIKNFKDFVREFLKYVLRTCEYYPLTMSGYVGSIHCSPFVSGLMLEIASEEHGIENNLNIYKYLEDDYYDLWSTQVQKFGFMIDKNAPWRLVFNVASGFKQYQDNPDKPKGAHIFMERKGVTYENIFQYRFLKAYKYDMLNLRATMHTLYTGFYQQFSTYEKEEFQLAKDGRCHRVKVTHERKDREPPPSFDEDAPPQENEYWLKVLLKLKMAETNYPHNPYSFSSQADDLIRNYRVFGEESALKYINNLTKGHKVTRFNMKGKYWHGVTAVEYEQRLRESLKNVEDPTRVQYSLTGTGNIIK